MDHNSDATAANSVITVSDVSCLSRPPVGYHILEITLISAQDLPPVSKSLRTYALVWTNPNRKRTTCIDQNGNTNPTWNDKFSFKVDDEFLASEKSAVTVEIYTVSWFRDVLVGTVSVNVSNLISPSEKGQKHVALQIRRPSGSPQGMLNIGATLTESTSKSMPLSDLLSSSSGYKKDLELEKRNILEYHNAEDEERERLHAKILQWRRSMTPDMMSDLNGEEFPGKPGSVCNDGSMVNGGSLVNYGSEVCSDVGPSASVVAAEIAKSWQASAAPRKEIMERGVGDSMVLPANLTPEEEKRRKEAAVDDENEEMEMIPKNGGRKKPDNGMYSCFVYGFQFTIVCGANNSNPNKTKKKKSDKSSD
ncbi:uncharacterized protein LOC116023662 [Ipomoea triloba]|uniref:uncharacterized protein LOC116023662 n=1 Tax=Ipomoea triloba TaxID=35885 RepID=UPI00125D9A8D|nr:uncharacterized protein LOC116023662 [Ipomoea triloba]